MCASAYGMEWNGWIDGCKRKYKNDRMKLDVEWRKSKSEQAERERVVVCVLVCCGKEPL